MGAGDGVMPYGEALHLLSALSVDPSSHVAAALNGWPHPLSREGFVLLDLFDLTNLWRTGKRGGEHPGRPKAPRRKLRPTVSQETAIAALRAAGHTKPLPGRKEVTHG